MKPRQYKRGDGSLEFFMTYGWIIVLALIAVATFAYMALPNNPQKTCVISSGFECKDFKIPTTGLAALTIENHLDSEVGNLDIKIGERDGTCAPKDDVPAGSLTTCTASIQPGSPGKLFTDSITFIYSEKGSILTHKAIGKITGEYE